MLFPYLGLLFFVGSECELMNKVQTRGKKNRFWESIYFFFFSVSEVFSSFPWMNWKLAVYPGSGNFWLNSYWGSLSKILGKSLYKTTFSEFGLLSSASSFFLISDNVFKERICASQTRVDVW